VERAVTLDLVRERAVLEHLGHVIGDALPRHAHVVHGDDVGMVGEWRRPASQRFEVHERFAGVKVDGDVTLERGLPSPEHHRISVHPDFDEVFAAGDGAGHQPAC
ncbi:MAG: hypothetical protein M3173_07990, partial [Chloroflexota bacterium]|nr:hypothetical protein [Chloroflexota bacterium]